MAAPQMDGVTERVQVISPKQHQPEPAAESKRVQVASSTSLDVPELLADAPEVGGSAYQRYMAISR
eukprot:4450457-Pyramimonas_sp.AAC.1